MKIPKKIAWPIGVAVVLVVAWLAFRPSPVLVEVAVAEAGFLRETIAEEGETRVRDRFVVSSPVAGRLVKIDLDEGDAVTAGSVVARVYPAPLETRSREQATGWLRAAEALEREARARVAQLEADLEEARRALERRERVAQEGHLTEEQLDRHRTAVAVKEREREAAVLRAEAAASDTRAARAALMDPDSDGSSSAAAVGVRAPTTGVVLRVFEESERVVGPGTPLLEVGDPTDLEVVVDVLSEDAVRVAVGQPLVVRAWGGDRELWCEVRRVEPSGFTKVSPLGVEEQRVNVIGDLHGAPPALGDRYRVEVGIVVWEGADVLGVPASALFRTGDGWGAFVVEDGRAVLREVGTGHRSTVRVEVTEGIREGETVILHPSDLVDDGVRVRAR